MKGDADRATPDCMPSQGGPPAAAGPSPMLEQTRLAIFIRRSAAQARVAFPAFDAGASWRSAGVWDWSEQDGAVVVVVLVAVARLLLAAAKASRLTAAFVASPPALSVVTPEAVGRLGRLVIAPTEPPAGTLVGSVAAPEAAPVAGPGVCGLPTGEGREPRLGRRRGGRPPSQADQKSRNTDKAGRFSNDVGGVHRIPPSWFVDCGETADDGWSLVLAALLAGLAASISLREKRVPSWAKREAEMRPASSIGTG